MCRGLTRTLAILVILLPTAAFADLSFDDHFVDQEYIPTSTVYYEPTEQGYEDILRQRLLKWGEKREGVEEKAGEERDKGPKAQKSRRKKADK